MTDKYPPFARPGETEAFAAADAYFGRSGATSMNPTQDAIGRELTLDIRMSLEALLAGEATIDETVADLRTLLTALDGDEAVERVARVIGPELNERIGEGWTEYELRIARAALNAVIGEL